MKIKTQKVIKSQEWDKTVNEVFGRPYCFQQQEGCRDRGVFELTVPQESEWDEDANETLPEEVNYPEMGVKFSSWLARDPKQKLSNPDAQEDYCLKLWWHRNFYPDVQMVANELHKRGTLEAGDYLIKIDW